MDKATKEPKATKAARTPRYFVTFRRDASPTARIEYVGPKRDDVCTYAISAFLTDKEDAEDVAAMWRRFLSGAIVTVEPVRPSAE